ncbi:hypothetical protein CRUP_009698, partial [Coryphaenoides rupestris]
MGCLGNSKTEDQRNEEKAQREANKKIEKQLQKDKQIYRATHRLLLLGKTGGFVRTIIYTSITFLALQCFMQIPFAYVPLSISGYWDVFLYHLGIVRFSTVDPGNIVRLLAPDLGLFIASVFVLRLLKKLLRPAPQISLHDNGTLPTDPEEVETTDTESEGESDVSGSFDSSDESTVVVNSGPPQFVQKLMVFAAGLRLLMSTIMNTAGKVVVTLLLGLAGIIAASMTSCVYFLVFLGLVWWWVFHRSLSMLLFSTLCIMLALFSAGHLLLLYLYQLPLAQALVPHQDIYARLFGMTGVIRTNASEPHSLRLHPEVSWPDFMNPLVLLLLYYTLVALLHKWVHVTEEETLDESEEKLSAEEPCGADVGPGTGPGSDGSAPPAGPGGLVVVGRLVQKHSYVGSLIIMMIWSITYNSWLTFALLVWSCIIWMMRDRRRYAMMSAPFLAVYGTVLVVMGFMSALRLSRAELYPGLPLAVIGDFDFNSYHPIFYTFNFWLMLRQQLQEIQAQRLLKEESLDEIRYDMWRRLLKTFWAVVVGYSMVVLIAIYMYQFRTVSGLFQEIMGMSEEGLRDLGLERYDTVELFARILLPAAFLLACILQLHYFNADFLSLTDLDNVPIRQHSREEELKRSVDVISEMLQKEQMNGRSQETLDSVGLSSCTDRGSQEKEPSLGEAEEASQKSGGDQGQGQWGVIVDRASLLLFHGLSALHRVQEICWRLLELHSLKIVSSGIIWVSLQEWIDNARARNAPLSGPLVREKAEELAAGLGEDDFKVSVGWFERFKRRENIVFKKLHGEAAEADTASRDEWLEDEWGQMRQDYAEEDIWNADESGIYFRALPDGTLTFKSDNKRGGKRSKERITALFACSAAGGKKELFVIGKSQNPRCFKNVRTLPVRYAANASAWMTGNLFVEWLKDWDHKLGRESKKILLLVDNCSAHHVKNTTLRNIRVEFLPKNTTSILQPCDQGIIRTAKAYFRKEMARSVLHQIDAGNRATAADIAKKISLLDSILMLRDAWADVGASTIRNCWKKGGLVMAPEEEPNTVDPPAEVSAEEFEQWITADDNTPVSEPVTDEDIIAEVRERFGGADAAGSNVGNEEEEEGEETAVPSPTEMRNAIQILKTGLLHVSLMNFVFLVLWAFALPFPRIRPIASNVSAVWACVMVVCKMFYQLKGLGPSNSSGGADVGGEMRANMVELLRRSVLYVEPVDPVYWCGAMLKTYLTRVPMPNVSLQNHLMVLGLLVFEATVHRHQLYYRLHNDLKAPPFSIIFLGITRQHMDHGILPCLKYFINFCFYKFGLEISLIVAVNVIGQRMDFYALLHACALLVILSRRRRKAIGEVWPKYCCFTAGLVVMQYLLYYPWRTTLQPLTSNVIKWFFLPDFAMRPDPSFIIYDHLLLLCSSLQWQMFEEENRAVVRLLAGENVEISRSLDPGCINQFIPVDNFLPLQVRRSYLDMTKVFLFSYFFWLVLCLIFITGTTRISVFCLGYLVACFYFMLFGSSLLMQPVRYILRLWDWLIGYTCLVIAMKNLLSRRVFLSYYFLFVVSDLKASKILASRGAELFEAKIKKQVAVRLELEKKSVETLKKQMEKIKSKQKPRSQDEEKPAAEVAPPDDADDDEKSKKDAGKWWKPWVSTPGVENNCGYHLFESDSEDEEEEEQETKEVEEAPPKKKTAFQLAYEAWVTSSKTALRDLKKEKKKLKKEEKKRARREMEMEHGLQRADSSEDELDESCAEEGQEEEEKENPLQRGVSTVKFIWAFVLSLLEDMTVGLNNFCKDSLDISKGREVSQESVKQFYDSWLSRQNTLSSQDGLDEGLPPPATPPSGTSSPRAYVKLRNAPSKVSWGSSFSSNTVPLALTAVLQKRPCWGPGSPPRRSWTTPTSLQPTDNQLRRRLLKTAHIDMGSLEERRHPPREEEEEEEEEEENEEEEEEEGNKEQEEQREEEEDKEGWCEVVERRDQALEEEGEAWERAEEHESLYPECTSLDFRDSVELGFALYNTMVSKSEMLCYFVIILNHIMSASMLSLILPILIFIINAERPFAMPNIIGVEKKDGYVLFDLIQLLALFFHRSILK